MDGDLLLDTGDGAIWTIVLNRPQALNAITMGMTARLLAILADAASDPGVRCLVVTGAGDAAFSAGFDIKEMAGFDPPAMREAFIARDPLFKAIALHRLPVIAAVNGKAHGAGALLAAACDFRFASSNAEFKVTAINYGSANATWSLPRIVGPHRAKHIIMTGRAVGSEEAAAIGLWDPVSGDLPVLATALDLAQVIASKPPEAIAAAKLLVDASLENSPESGWQAEHSHVVDQLEARHAGGNRIFDAFLSKHV